MDIKFAAMVAGSILGSVGVIICINVFVDAIYPVSPVPGGETRSSASAPVTPEPPKVTPADPAPAPAVAVKPDQETSDGREPQVAQEPSDGREPQVAQEPSDGRDQQASLSWPERLAAAKVDAGQVAARKCAICHTFDKGGPHRVGPNLYNIVNAPVGTQAGFAYSAAMKQHGGKWDYEFLDCYIGNTKTCIPGNKMAFAGIKNAAERADIILYLRSLSDTPAPLTPQ